MKTTNNIVWKGIQIICWIIFIGYCIQAGALLFNFIYGLFKPLAYNRLYLDLDLSDLYHKSESFYTLVFTLIVAISVLKAGIFYVALKLFKTLNFEKPFDDYVSGIISRISYFTFFIGIISIVAQKFLGKLSDKGYDIQSVESYFHDGRAFLLITVILLAIIYIFKKGIELQSENDLTI